MTDRLPFHEQLRYERELRGWSQADLAEKVRCDTKTIGRWESGSSLPRPYHRQLLSETFDKSVEELGLLKGYTRLDSPPASADTSRQSQKASISSTKQTHIFHQSWKHLSSTARLLLIYIGRTVATTVSWEELAGIGIAKHEHELQAAIYQLVNYSLLDVYTTTGQIRYGIHQLTRQFINSDLPTLWETGE